MNVSKKFDNYLYGIRIGLIFYFYQDPNKYKDSLKKLCNRFCEITQPDFQYYYKNTAILKRLNSDGKKLLEDFVEESDFYKTKAFGLIDGNKVTLQSTQIQLVFSTTESEYLCRLPSWIYFEFEPKLSWEIIEAFIKEAFEDLTYHYVCSHYIMACNEHLRAKSKPISTKKLREYILLNDVDAIWKNGRFLMELEKGIDEVNFIQGFSKEFYSKLNLNLILQTQQEEIVKTQLGKDYVMLNMLNNNDIILNDTLYMQLRKMHNLFKPIILDINKPQLYWKQDEWDKWRRRFE